MLIRYCESEMSEIETYASLFCDIGIERTRKCHRLTKRKTFILMYLVRPFRAHYMAVHVFAQFSGINQKVLEN